MLKQIFLIFWFGLTGLSVFSQIQDPVKWDFSVGKASGDTYDLKFTATIENKWHLYGKDIPEGGPVPTSFRFDKSSDFERIDEIKELSKGETKYDNSFGMNIKMFANKAVFVQRIRAKSGDPFVIKGTLEFMSCNDVNCLPPKEVPFSFSIPATKLSAAIPKKDSAVVAAVIKTDTLKTLKDTVRKDTANVKAAAGVNIPEDKEPESPIGFLFYALLWGLAGVITPCVYPMIPMTVSFFMRGEEKRSRGIVKAITFGISIVAIYTLIGVLVSLSILSANVGNILSTHWIPNTIFFFLFVVFAASFFGMFEMVLPGTLVNKIDQQAEKGGLAGSFFMALTLVIVSFSCTGPIVGKILIEASRGLAVKPIAGMFGYSLAFALPFTFFAIFPSFLKDLPKSGGWLNSVKIVLGFIVLAFSLTFVAAIDQKYNLNILSRDLFIVIWIVLSLLLGFYLLGKIKFAHDSEISHIGVPRFFLVVVVFVFAGYLMTGLWGNNLKALNWILPPPETKTSSVPSAASTVPNNLCGTPKYSDFLSLPHQLTGYFDYNEGLACAKEKNKPVLLDFKGHTCKNCKLMEANVWPDSRIMQLLRNDFIIISLYTDDPHKLAENEWVASTYDKEVKKTIGAKNLDLEITKFDTNTQPLYAIVDSEGNLLVKRTVTYDPNPDHFLKFLQEGKAEHEKKGIK